MKDYYRFSLLAGIGIVLFLLLLEWRDFSHHKEQARIKNERHSATDLGSSNSLEQEQPMSAGSDDIPTIEKTSSEKQKEEPSSRLVHVRTDVLDVVIDLHGGDIVSLSLPTHWASLETPDIPFNLLARTTEKTYISQSGLIGKNGTDRNGERPVYGASSTNYELGSEQRLIVDLTLPNENGVSIIKRYEFSRGDFLIGVRYLVDNQSSTTWEASFFGQIKRDNSVPANTATGLQPFLGAATTNTEEPYQKMDFDDIEKNPFNQSVVGGWVAFVQHYFVSAWIGNKEDNNSYRIKKLSGDSIYVMGYTGPQIQVPAGTSAELGGFFYSGPKITQRLEEISPYLDLTVDYGWLWWVAKPIHWVLQAAFLMIGNWGWSIIALTVFIKLILFPLSHKAYISMGHMRKVAPKMAEIKERCGDNRQKLQEEMMKLYRTEKINPLGGCLPMLLQMPVFISLYWVLMESVELRHSPFIGWINDLSVMDPYFCLPILMGISMFLQQKMNPAPPDPMQAKVMQWLPVIFTFMFLWFPAGLVLYWLVNNIFSMIHQGYINKKVEAGAL